MIDNQKKTVSMTPKDFTAGLERMAVAVQGFVEAQAPRIAGKTAAAFFEENFARQGFQAGGLKPWQEVKRRADPRLAGKAAGSRPILIGTGNLRRSIGYTTGTASATVFSDAPYAAAHNQGTTTAGRGHATTIPKRQFMGESPELNKLVISEIERKLNTIIK
jgi:phage gpG-like protein